MGQIVTSGSDSSQQLVSSAFFKLHHYDFSEFCFWKLQQIVFFPFKGIFLKMSTEQSEKSILGWKWGGEVTRDYDFRHDLEALTLSFWGHGHISDTLLI